jgi:hypothetical protein
MQKRKDGDKDRGSKKKKRGEDSATGTSVGGGVTGPSMAAA